MCCEKLLESKWTISNKQTTPSLCSYLCVPTMCRPWQATSRRCLLNPRVDQFILLHEEETGG